MITIHQLALPYALSNINCHLPQHKLIGILGANGAGKSTLLKAIAGIISPSKGYIDINGQRLSELNHVARSRLIAYLAQNTPVHWHLSVYDIIALGLQDSQPRSEEKHHVHKVAERFHLTDCLTKPLHKLSGGERGRVHLARCVIKNTPILLADEPIAALDPYYQIDMMEQLQSLSRQHTCLVVLHQLSLAYRYCDEIVLLKKGHIIASGETSVVLCEENLTTAFSISATIDIDNRSINNIQKYHDAL